MNARVNHLLHEALDLAPDERSAPVVALMDSLEGSDAASIGDAWRAEVLRRREALRAGLMAAVPWREARARLAES